MTTKESFALSSKEDFQTGSTEKPSNLSSIKHWVERLAVETGGIQRVTDEDRAKNTSKWWNACTFWQVASISTETTDLTHEITG